MRSKSKLEEQSGNNNAKTDEGIFEPKNDAFLEEIKLLKQKKRNQVEMTTTSLIIPKKLWRDFSVIVLKKYGFKGDTQTKARKSKSAVITEFLEKYVAQNKSVLTQTE